ncbi:MAG TPA: hypothetical protein DIT97_28745 [Gimesia maris]|uniref:Uncharacterized protein n=1 Tax=Gimesia maris TaxID=122 RepID=A0A3D3RFD6_9PLAN|nr:hypothetical protein [Gimesia maris]|tara:strand:- start:77 stop:721 length:645 start_codon:yes stop_codon:yes gene_type:complete
MISAEKNKEQVSGQLDRENQFLAILPEIRRQALFAFRALRTEAKEEAVAEAIANAFVSYNRLIEQGKGSKIYPSVLTRYAVAQIRSGRMVGTSLNSNCVLSEAAKQKYGLRVDRLDYCAKCGEWFEFIVEDRRTPVPDQAAFRCDFPNWLGTLSPQKRQIAERLAVGDTTSEVAQTCKVSPGRVSQIRRELDDSWQEFHRELEDYSRTTIVATG